MPRPDIKVLNPLKPHYVNRQKLLAFDVETYQEDKKNNLNLHYKHQRFYMGCVKGENIERAFWNKNDMKDYLLGHSTRGAMIFATNLDFDFNILFSGDKRLKGALFVEKGALIHVKLNINDKIWRFYDTLNFTKAGVKKLGELFKDEKLKAPGWLGQKANNKEERELLQKYCMQDANVSFKFSMYLRDYCNRLGMKMKVTIASTGLDYWRRSHQKFGLFQERREWLDLHYKGSFKGGRTEVFKRGLFDKVHGYDFKSMYPSVCYNGIDGKGIYPNPNSVYRLEKGNISYIEEFEGISKVKVFCPYMYIPLLCIHSLDSKLYFPIGEFEGWFTHVELREAIKNGYEIREVQDTIYYTTYFTPFREAVQKLYNLRMEFKKEGNAIMTQLVKDQMNSGIFGKFAQKINNKSEMFLLDDVHADNDGSTYVYKYGDKHYLENYIERGGYVYNKINEPSRVPLFIFPILSSYTTAMARIKLWKALIKYPREIIYTDTDSLFLTNKRFGDSQKLGELEYLGGYEKAIFVKPKQYCLYDSEREQDVIKLKGVPARYIEGRSHFNDLLDGKSVKMMRFTKVKESAVRKIPYGSIIDIEKYLSAEDTKRKWALKFNKLESQDSEPLKVIEGFSELEYDLLQRKARQNYEKEQAKLLDKQSDLFEERFADTFDSMGEDIEEEEFLENEQFFAMNE